MAEATSNPEMIQRTRALAAFSSAKEYASIQRAVIAAALPATDATYGKLSENDRQYGLSAFENQKAELTSFAQHLRGQRRASSPSRSTSRSPTIKAADTYAERVLRARERSRSCATSARTWTGCDADSAKIQQMSNIELTLLNEMEQKARELRNEAEQEAIISGALILLVLGVSLVGAFVVARSMIRSLRRLQDTATKVAQDRLPELVKQLSESDPQDVDTSVESVGVHSRDEIGQVAAAFDDVHREAVRLAAEQALLRGNVNAMFTNLSRRSQGLIQRQLSLISELESREADPDQLSSLFKLDHLATRMRRNGENLLVLAGEEPGRRWTRPVPLVDVLRAAASEVEQYERIELSAVPTTEVAGRVVNDLVHLLAELLENATSFSSPQTKVKVTGHALPDGRVLIEIHDTGIGLSPEDLAAINERLASPPTVDVSVSRRMGLFVVGRLSQRHGIRIQLRPSDSGGTTALVMLPVDVAQGGKKVPGNKPGQGVPAGGGPAAAQAAAGVAAARRGGAGGGPALGAGAPARRQRRSAQRPVRSAARSAPEPGPRAALPRPRRGRSPGRTGPGGPGGLAVGPRSPRRAGRPRPVPVPRRPSTASATADSGRQDAFRLRSADAFGGGRQDTMGGNNRGPVPPQPQQRPAGGDQGRRPPQQAAAAAARWSACRAARRQPAAAGAQLERRQRAAAGAAFLAGRPARPRGAGRHLADAADRRPSGPGFSRVHLGVPADRRPSGCRFHGRVPAAGLRRPASRRGRAAEQRAVRPPGRLRYAESFRRGPEPVRERPVQPPGPRRHRPVLDARLRRWFHRSVRGARAGCSAGSTGQFPAPNHGERQGGGTGQFERPGANGTTAPAPSVRSRVGVPRSPRSPRRCRPRGSRRRPYAAVRHPGDQLVQPGAAVAGNGAQARSRPAQAARTQAPAAPQRPAPAASGSASWRTTPNDELGRQAERVRQPSAGGVTVSGLPRRVPRANLVAGTAQQQQHQTGPQVSRAPDDVRGRLTNLRRGIQQGRQAGTGQTGSFPSPTHQQER